MRTCTADGCERRLYVRGLCKAHYGRLIRHNDIHRGGPVISKFASIKERIEAKSIPEPNTGCWIWLGPTNGVGINQRGKMSVGDTNQSTHRLSYEAFVGPITGGLFVCHKCDVGLCVNPDHLFLGTHIDNMRDMMRKGRHGGAKRSEGVTPYRNGKWRAYFYRGSKQFHIGVFADRDSAVNAVAANAARLHAEASL